MTARPRRSAAQRASETITDMADRDIYVSTEPPPATMSSRARRGDSGSGRNPSGDPRKQRKSGVSNSSASRRDRSESHDVVRSSRARPTRGPQKRYVESSDDEDAEGDDDAVDEDDDDDDDDEEEEHDVIRVGDGMDMDAEGDDDDAEGEPDDMALDVDADGDADEDAEGDLDMDAPTPVKPAPVPTSVPAPKAAKPAARATKAAKVPKSKASSTTKRRSAAAGGNGSSSRKRARADADGEDDDGELSDTGSVGEGAINASVEVAGDDDAEGDEDDDDDDMEGDDDDMEDDDDDDAEGDDDDDEDVEGGGGGDDDDDDREGTPDLTKMTRRQRARFEETPQEYMKLSDEVQVKKVFTAEELSMRRAEMARRRRNLSDKRNEEVKAETINKLLKRQAPKTTKKNALGDDDDDEGGHSTASVFIRWTSNQQGSRVAVSDDVLASPLGARVFGAPSSRPRARKMVEEV